MRFHLEMLWYETGDHIKPGELRKVYGVLYGTDAATDQRGMWIMFGRTRICLFSITGQKAYELHSLLTELKGRYDIARSQFPFL